MPLLGSIQDARRELQLLHHANLFEMQDMGLQ
jgi:hypothetical protein